MWKYVLPTLLLCGSALAQPQTPPTSVTVNAGLAPATIAPNSSNHLIFTYPGGATIDGGVLPSAAAPIYQSGAPSGAGTTGQLAYDTATRNLYIYQSGSWTVMGSLAAAIVSSANSLTITGGSFPATAGVANTPDFQGPATGVASGPVITSAYSQWCIEAWIGNTYDTGSGQVVIRQDGVAGLIKTGAGFLMQLGSGTYTASTSSGYSDGGLHFVRINGNDAGAGTASLYIDNMTTPVLTASGASYVYTNPLKVNEGTYPGQIDSVRISKINRNSAASFTEPATDTNTLALYTFDASNGADTH